MARAEDPQVEEALGGRERPKGWAWMSRVEQLDWIATRIIAEDRAARGLSHRQMIEDGILSDSQHDRRQRHEVYSLEGDLDRIRPREGVFSRVHVRDLRGRRARVTAEEEG